MAHKYHRITFYLEMGYKPCANAHVVFIKSSSGTDLTDIKFKCQALFLIRC
jgi:hypothetical protein